MHCDMTPQPPFQADARAGRERRWLPAARDAIGNTPLVADRHALIDRAVHLDAACSGTRSASAAGYAARADERGNEGCSQCFHRKKKRRRAPARHDRAPGESSDVAFYARRRGKRSNRRRRARASPTPRSGVRPFGLAHPAPR
ncbi:hypothetical protein, partial [Burkholderia thailandensis]|uniref:hypothetical protein n=1 Tax=Burkholderia thailandensis TaxID=57975 RepID=UPI002165B8B7